MKKTVLLATLILATLSANAFAERNEKWESLFRSQLHAAEDVTSYASDPPGNTEWTFSRLMLRVQGKIGFDVSWLAKFLVIPEVETVFIKE